MYNTNRILLPLKEDNMMRKRKFEHKIVEGGKYDEESLDSFANEG